MRVTEKPSPRLPLDVRPLRRSARTPAPSDDAPFGAIVGALIGILISVPLWALLAVVVALLRRG
jgi:hypothetical protein